MKKILLSLSVIVAVAAVAVGATTAYFSESATSEGNTFSAGTLDLEIDEDHPSQDFSVAFENMVPGEWTEKQKLVLRNTGGMTQVIDSIQVSDLEENDRKTTLEDEVDQEYVWGDGLKDLDDPLEVQVNYDDNNRAVFHAWSSEDYGATGDDMMTFAFDTNADGEADYQIQWNKDGDLEWHYQEVESGSWGDWFDVPSDFVAERDGKHFWVKLPIEELGGYDSEYKFGVDSNGQGSGEGQTFYSTDPEHLWYNEDNYVSSDYYVQMSTKSAKDVGTGNFAKKVNVRMYDKDHPNNPIRTGNLWNFYTDGGDKNMILDGDEVTLDPGDATGNYRFEFQLDGSADNDFQGDGIDASFKVKAVQEGQE